MLMSSLGAAQGMMSAMGSKTPAPAGGTQQYATKATQGPANYQDNYAMQQRPAISNAQATQREGVVDKNPWNSRAMNDQLNATQNQQNWMNQLLFPAMQAEVAEQEGRETAVWNNAQNQTNILNNQAANQRIAGQQQATLLDGQQRDSFRNAVGADAFAAGEMGRYGSQGRAVQDSIMRDAMSFDTPGRAEQFASQARGDAAAAFGVQQQEQQRQQAAYGINPNSGAAIAGATKDRNQMAAQSVAAGNRARMAAEELGWGRRMDAAGVGQQMFNNAQQAGNMGMQQRQVGAALGGQAVDMRGAGAGLMGQATSTLGAGFDAGQAGFANVQGMGNTVNQGFQTQFQGIQGMGDLANADHATRTGLATANQANRTARRGQNQEMIGGLVGAGVGVAGLVVF